MPGWNGAGVFVLPYSFVAEAAANIKILASHQDTQWNAIKAGLELCQTRDGQNSPAADIAWAGHKITGLGTPVDPADATNKAYVDAAVTGEWIPETFSVAWVSATSFKVNGTNVTSKYHAGRRVKITHNSGGSTAYGTVVSSTFSTDTTVVVTTDAAVALVSTVTAIAYGGLSYTNDAYLDPRTALMVYLDNPVLVTPPLNKILLNVKATDSNTEWSSLNKRWVCRYPGNYLVSAMVALLPSASGTAVVMIFKNGSNILEVFRNLTSGLSYQTVVVPSTVLSFVKGDYVELYLQGVSALMNGDVSLPDTSMSITRIS